MTEQPASELNGYWQECPKPAFAEAVRAGARCRRRSLLLLTIVVNLLALALYLWSLQERTHVVISATPNQLVARIGNDVAVLHHPVRGGSSGVYSGPAASILINPTGQAAMPSHTSMLTVLGSLFRLAGPGPAWDDFQISDVRGRPHDTACLSPCPALSSTIWSPTFEGAGAERGRAALLAATSSRRYRLSADLLRGEGDQGLLVDVNPAGNGYLLEIRMDRPDVSWFEWTHGKTGRRLSYQLLTRLEALPMLQRTLRSLLTSVIVAQAFVVLLLVVFGLGRVLSPLLRWLAQPFPRRRICRLAIPEAADAGAMIMAAMGCVAALMVANWIFDEEPHGVDAVAYVFQARIFALGRLSAPTPRLPSFFSEMHLITYHGHWFTHDTPGWPLILALGIAAGVPWLINPMLAAGTMLLLYLIGREVYDPPTALLAVALLLTSPFFLFLGGSYMSHTLTLFCLVGFAYLLIRWDRLDHRAGGKSGRSRRYRYLFLAGILLGMAFITRQLDAVAFALPFGLLILKRIRAGPMLLLGAIGPALFMLVYNWTLSGSLRINLYTMEWAFDHPGFGPHVGPTGFTPAQGLWNTTYRLEMLHAHLFGWPFYTALALAMTPFVIGQAKRWDTLFAASALCVMVGYVFFWWPGVSYGPRYWSATIPCFALLVARGVTELYRLPLRLGFRPDRMAALLGPCLLTVLFVLYDLTVYLPAQVPLYQHYDYMSSGPIQAVQHADLHHALVFVVTRPEQWSYGEVFPGNSPLLNGDIIYARDRGQADSVLMGRYSGWRYYLLDGTRLTRLSVHFPAVVAVDAGTTRKA